MAVNRRDFLGMAASGVASAHLPRISGADPANSEAEKRTELSGSAAATTPNILLLFPDQWRFDWMSDNPAFVLRTPHLDSLRKRGTHFTRAIVASPVCGPSRACLASGMEYDHQAVSGNAINYPTKQPTFYSKLRDHGYSVLGCGKMDLAKGSNWWGVDGKWRTAAWGFTDAVNNAGKWDQLSGLRLNGGAPPDPYTSFLQGRGLLREHVADYQKRQPLGYGATFPTPLPDDAYSDNWVTDVALGLLNAAPAGKPWFLQVNWPGPHDPEDITTSMERTVRGRSMPPVNGADEYDAAKNQLIRQNYSAMCENIDRCIGRILDYLDSMQQTGNTLVIFSSDHGEMLGDHGQWGKSVPYQPSVGVPLLVAGPGVRTGATSDALLSSIDLTATILDFAGASQKGIDGRTLRPVLEGRSGHHRDVVYSGLGSWRMVWDGRHKVITGFDPNRIEGEGSAGPNSSPYAPSVAALPALAFDLEQDQGERDNRGGEMSNEAAALFAKLKTGSYPA